MKLHFHKYSKWSDPNLSYQNSLEQYCYCLICNKVKYRAFHTSKVVNNLNAIIDRLKNLK